MRFLLGIFLAGVAIFCAWSALTMLMYLIFFDAMLWGFAAFASGMFAVVCFENYEDYR